MKKIFTTIFYIALVGVLLAKISDWFVDYDKRTNELINTAMFCLIGIGYIWQSFQHVKKLYTAIFFVCGVYIILMNFIERNTTLTTIGIACILIPLIIGKFSKDGKIATD